MLVYMKKPTLLRVISIAGLCIAIIGVAAFVAYRFGNKKPNTPAASPVEQPKAEQLKMPTQEQVKKTLTQLDGISAMQREYNTKNYKQAITLANTYVNQKDVDDLSKLQAYVVCISAAIDSKDTSSKETCHSGALVVINTLTNQQDKTGWQKYIDDLYNGVPAQGDDGGR